MTQNTQTEIRSLIENFANELAAVSRRAAVQDVLASLGSAVGAPAKRGPGRPRGSGAKKRGRPVGSKNRPKAQAGVHGKRTTEAVAEMGERLLAYIKAQPGRRGEQIAKVFHTEVKTIRLPMLRLIAEKKVRTQGQRRGMTYLPGGASAPAVVASSTPAKHGGKKAGRRAKRKAA